MTARLLKQGLSTSQTEHYYRRFWEILYDVVVIDEAHERTLRTDMILGFLKGIQAKRKEMARSAEKGKSGEAIGPLKIVVMSATIDAERFSKFFNEYVLS
jgi:HrpA-like RNA helicase